MRDKKRKRKFYFQISGIISNKLKNICGLKKVLIDLFSLLFGALPSFYSFKLWKQHSADLLFSQQSSMFKCKKKSRRQRLKPGRRSCLRKTNTVFFGRLGADTKFDWLAQIAANPFLKILKRWWLLSHFLIIVLRKKGQKGVLNSSKRILRQNFGKLTKLTSGCVLQVLVFPKISTKNSNTVKWTNNFSTNFQKFEWLYDETCLDKFKQYLTGFYITFVFLNFLCSRVGRPRFQDI